MGVCQVRTRPPWLLFSIARGHLVLICGRRFSVITDQGIKNNTNAEATLQAGENPDFGISDLYESIDNGDFPSWTVYFQTMDAKTAESFKYNVFDLTKGTQFRFPLQGVNPLTFKWFTEWRVEDVPLQEVGRITLNQNPSVANVAFMCSVCLILDA